MKILTFNYMETTEPGGINKTVREISKNLFYLGHDITVLQGNPSHLSDEEMFEGFKIIRVGSVFENYLHGLNLKMYLYLRENYMKLNPDIIHIHGYHTLFTAEILLILTKIVKAGAPIIFTPHYDPLNHNTLTGKIFGRFYDKWIGKRILKLSNNIISISEFESNNVKNILGNSYNITVIPHGVDKIHSAQKEKKTDGYIKLLYVGYLLEYKGVQHILEAVYELIQSCKMKNIKVTIIGDGDYKEQLKIQSKKLNIENYLIWKTFLPHSQVLEEMKSADIFLLLSKSEGYGLVVAEALSVGTPAIVTNGTALEEFTKENGCLGVDYPPNPKIVAELVKELYFDGIQVGPFSSKIRTWDKVADDYARVYNNIRVL